MNFVREVVGLLHFQAFLVCLIIKYFPLHTTLLTPINCDLHVNLFDFYLLAHFFSLYFLGVWRCFVMDALSSISIWIRPVINEAALPCNWQTQFIPSLASQKSCRVMVKVLLSHQVTCLYK